VRDNNTDMDTYIDKEEEREQKGRKKKKKKKKTEGPSTDYLLSIVNMTTPSKHVQIRGQTCDIIASVFPIETW
jgi:hypothetical protein